MGENNLIPFLSPCVVPDRILSWVFFLSWVPRFQFSFERHKYHSRFTMALWRNYEVLQKNVYRDWLFASDTGKFRHFSLVVWSPNKSSSVISGYWKDLGESSWSLAEKNKPDLPWTSPAKAQKGQETLKVQCDPFLNVAIHGFFHQRGSELHPGE